MTIKVGNISHHDIVYRIELQKLAQQERIKQQQIKVIRDRQKEIEQMRPQDPNKGQYIDKMV